MAKEKRVLIYFDELVMALTNTYGKTMDTHIYSPRDILSSIQGINSVDAEEVVRCKDCENCFPHLLRNGEVYFYECAIHDIEVEKDDFCSCGERRTDD